MRSIQNRLADVRRGAWLTRFNLKKLLKSGLIDENNLQRNQDKIPLKYNSSSMAF